MGNMKAVFLPLFINSVAIKFHGRDLCKVVKQDATGEGLGMWGEASSSSGLGVQPGGVPLVSSCVGSVPGGSVARGFELPWLPPSRESLGTLLSLSGSQFPCL